MGGIKYCKMFLIGSNIGLLFVGMTIFILGIKMQWALSVLLLINIPIVMKVVQACIACGVFITFSGLTGLCGACTENKWLILGYLLSLGIIVVMKFSLVVTLMMVQKTIAAALQTPDCNNVCSASIDAAILDYALPSAGLMSSVLFVEALMIYSSIKMYFFLRDAPKVAEPSNVAQDEHLSNVGQSLSPFVTLPTPIHSSPYEFSPQHLNRSYVCQISRRANSNLAFEEDPPEYGTLSLQPHYHDRTTSTWVESGLESSLDTSENTEFKETDGDYQNV